MTLDAPLCDAKVCRIGTAKISYYYDDDPLSRVGAHLVAPELIRQMR